MNNTSLRDLAAAPSASGTPITGPAKATVSLQIDERYLFSARRIQDAFLTQFGQAPDLKDIVELCLIDADPNTISERLAQKLFTTPPIITPVSHAT
jgi:hypothetical protein